MKKELFVIFLTNSIRFRTSCGFSWNFYIKTKLNCISYNNLMSEFPFDQQKSGKKNLSSKSKTKQDAQAQKKDQSGAQFLAQLYYTVKDGLKVIMFNFLSNIFRKPSLPKLKEAEEANKNQVKHRIKCCPICLENFPLEKFMQYQCSSTHGLCVECHKGYILFRDGKLCPLCRELVLK